MRRAREYRIVETDGHGMALVVVDAEIASVKEGRAWVRDQGATDVSYRVIAVLTPELRVRVKERRVIEERAE